MSKSIATTGGYFRVVICLSTVRVMYATQTKDMPHMREDIIEITLIHVLQ